jgi:superfamily II DNA helicase RecQ
LEGKNLFGVLPTGFGKTLIAMFALLAFDKLAPGEGLSIGMQVGPLVGLLQKQCDYFNAHGLKSIFIGGELTAQQEEELERGDYRMIFANPEAVTSSVFWKRAFSSKVYEKRFKLFVLDEAHTQHDWGKDFRVHFAALGVLHVWHPAVWAVMTATATAEVRDSVLSALRLEAVVVNEPPQRANTLYSFTTVKDKYARDYFSPLIARLQEFGEKTPRVVIYTNESRDVRALYAHMKEHLPEHLFTSVESPGVGVLEMYHGGTLQPKQTEILESVYDPSGRCRVLIATIRGAMGLDMTDVQTVVNWGQSRDMTQYVQQTGRAGRNLPRAVAILVQWRDGGFHAGRGSKTEIADYCMLTTCRRRFIAEFFGHAQSVPVAVSHLCCDVCAKTCECTPGGTCPVPAPTTT